MDEDFVLVRPAWVTTWWWKSTTDFAVGTVSQRQGCPPRGGIRRKSAANTRTDEQKLHIKAEQGGMSLPNKVKSDTARIPHSK